MLGAKTMVWSSALDRAQYADTAHRVALAFSESAVADVELHRIIDVPMRIGG